MLMLNLLTHTEIWYFSTFQQVSLAWWCSLDKVITGELCSPLTGPGVCLLVSMTTISCEAKITQMVPSLLPAWWLSSYDGGGTMVCGLLWCGVVWCGVVWCYSHHCWHRTEDWSSGAVEWSSVVDWSAPGGGWLSLCHTGTVGLLTTIETRPHYLVLLASILQYFGFSQ